MMPIRSVTVYDCPVLKELKAVLTDPSGLPTKSGRSLDDSPPSPHFGQLNPGAAQLYGQYLASTAPLMAAHDAHVLAAVLAYPMSVSPKHGPSMGSGI